MPNIFEKPKKGLGMGKCWEIDLESGIYYVDRHGLQYNACGNGVWIGLTRQRQEIVKGFDLFTIKDDYEPIQGVQ